MNRVNLIPAYRIQAKKRRLRACYWVAACPACAFLLLAAYGVCYAVFAPEGPSAHEELRAVAAKIKASEAAMEAARSQLAEAEVELAANRAVGNQPDWSILLASVSARLGEDIVLRECRLGDRTGPEDRRPNTGFRGQKSAHGPRPPVAGHRPFTLTLIGYGRSLPAVSQFALRLEQSKVFRAGGVRLVRNAREPFLADTAIAFEAVCSLRDNGAGSR